MNKRGLSIFVVGKSLEDKDAMIDALPTLKERLSKGDPNVLFSVINDLSKVMFFIHDSCVLLEAKFPITISWFSSHASLYSVHSSLLVSCEN